MKNDLFYFSLLLFFIFSFFKEMILLCDAIINTTDTEARRGLRLRLRGLCSTDDHFEVVVRSLKWSKVMSVWKYPEVVSALKEKTEQSVMSLDDPFGAEEEPEVVEKKEADFFGFWWETARSSLHITRFTTFVSS